jgi:hypothetical protein
MINHCDRGTTHLSDTDIPFVLFNISSKCHLYKCLVLLAITQNAQESKN